MLYNSINVGFVFEFNYLSVFRGGSLKMKGDGWATFSVYIFNLLFCILHLLHRTLFSPPIATQDFFPLTSNFVMKHSYGIYKRVDVSN